MPSRQARVREAFVWVWLPAATDPVVAGTLNVERGRLTFNYGRSYLERPKAISIYEPELPLKAGPLSLLPGLSMPGCIRDGAPDAWGRRVLINRLLGRRGARVDTAELDELTYLLEEALQHGTAIGGARPKALVVDGTRKFVAKFSSSTDLYSVVKAEFIAMRLARHVGLDVAPVMLKRAAKKDVLLVERFDRLNAGGPWQRRAIVSALTLLGLDEMMARYASYQDLAEIVRHRFADAPETLRELFSRLVFNVLTGNTDDHARNHAAFWDGARLTLTPAYDICPQPRTGNEASQAMLISGEDRMSRISSCLAAAHHFLLSSAEALDIAQKQVEAIVTHWDDTCEEARITKTDRKLLATRQFLNPYSIEGLATSPPRLAC